MASSDRNYYRRCIVCRKKIEREHTPWSMISISGEETYWHSFCDKENNNE